jgi:hypothetical protein
MSHHLKYHRILAIAPSWRGFGFAVFEGENTLVDWGVKSVEGEKNKECIKKLGKMMAHYRPDILALEDFDAKGSRRSARIRALGSEIIELVRKDGGSVAQISRDQVMETFFEDGDGTRYAIAGILARRFPEELGSRLPPKRRPWKSEDYRMSIFDAVALALVERLRACFENAIFQL